MNNITLPENWNDWTLVKQLGRGASGTVYLAERQTGETTEKSAIKIVTVSTEDEEKNFLFSFFNRPDAQRVYLLQKLQPYLDEIKIMQTLKNSPHIVQLRDYAILESDDHSTWTVFIRMEYLESLEEHMTRIFPARREMSELSDEFAAEIKSLGCDICEALTACHDKNILHRDIKPANIFWSEKGGYKLGDFDAACFEDSAATGNASTGTLYYMAPEVYHGEAGDRTADIYSLGLLLYKYLNRDNVPFVSEDDASDIVQVKKAIRMRLTGEELPLPYLKGTIAHPVMQACRFAPDMRFQSAALLKAALSEG